MFRRILFGSDGIRAGWRLLLYLIFAIVLICVLTYVVLQVPPWRVPGFRLGKLLPLELIAVLATVTAAAIMSKIERRPFGSYGLPRKGAFGTRFCEGAAWGFMAMTVVLLILRVTRSFSFGSMELRGYRFLHYALGWGAYFVAVGLYEEFTFRGYPQFTLATGMGFWPAAFLLSAIFGAVHFANPGENWMGVFQVFLAAILFCLSLRRTGDLWFAVGLHGAWDWAETFFYGVPDSGFQGPGHFLNPTFHGRTWLTGGTAGPEASIVTLLVEIAMMGLVLVRFRSSPKIVQAT
ncbi:MAG TPA: type II CAAX endopeptidase family protein [Candidatus Acidoferrales bacterium]|nr:type II CAAX endopeptidase family protein [Candidatus Acidoferrales bacterium]